MFKAPKANGVLLHAVLHIGWLLKTTCQLRRPAHGWLWGTNWQLAFLQQPIWLGERYIIANDMVNKLQWIWYHQRSVNHTGIGLTQWRQQEGEQGETWGRQQNWLGSTEVWERPTNWDKIFLLCFRGKPINKIRMLQRDAHQLNWKVSDTCSGPKLLSWGPSTSQPA